MNKFPSFTQWVQWLGATLIAAVTLTAYAYTNFVTKEDFKEHKQDIVERLTRIENLLINGHKISK